MKKIIMGIQVGFREDDVPEVQKLLTEYGCYIKTRIGVHDAEPDKEVCSEIGIILLEFVTEADDKVAELEGKLAEIESVAVKKMEFEI